MNAEQPRKRGREGWLSDRLGFGDIVASLAKHRAPRRGFVFYLGGITLFLLLVQVLSGVLLVLYYKPDSLNAHPSVERIIGEIPYGDLIRGVHVWASDFFVACLLAHLFTIVIRRSYKPPHELTWLSGLVALVIGLGMAFTGAILPWSQKAYAQARVGSEIAHNIPIIGGWVYRLLRGGQEVTSNTLSNAYGFHVAVLPATVTLLVGLHLFFLSRKPALVPVSEQVVEESEEEGADGDAPKPAAAKQAAQSDDDTIPLYPDFLYRQAVAWVGVLVAVMTLAIFADRPLGEAADPRLSSAGAQPPWYFLPFHQIIRSSPRELLGIDGAKFIVGATCFLGLLVVALPFLDRKGSKLMAWAGWIVLFVLFLLATSALS
jgi:quinol-cytochrome oxidoreductase complex cytochrome b subunit